MKNVIICMIVSLSTMPIQLSCYPVFNGDSIKKSLPEHNLATPKNDAALTEQSPLAGYALDPVNEPANHSTQGIDATNELETIEQQIIAEDNAHAHVDLNLLITYVAQTLIENAHNPELSHELTQLLTALFELILENMHQQEEADKILNKNKSIFSSAMQPLDKTHLILNNCTDMADSIAAIVSTPKDRATVTKNIANLFKALLTIIFAVLKKPL